MSEYHNDANYGYDDINTHCDFCDMPLTGRNVDTEFCSDECETMMRNMVKPYMCYELYLAVQKIVSGSKRIDGGDFQVERSAYMNAVAALDQFQR